MTNSINNIDDFIKFCKTAPARIYTRSWYKFYMFDETTILIIEDDTYKFKVKFFKESSLRYSLFNKKTFKFSKFKYEEMNKNLSIYKDQYYYYSTFVNIIHNRAIECGAFKAKSDKLSSVLKV